MHHFHSLSFHRLSFIRLWAWQYIKRKCNTLYCLLKHFLSLYHLVIEGLYLFFISFFLFKNFYLWCNIWKKNVHILSDSKQEILYPFKMVVRRTECLKWSARIRSIADGRNSFFFLWKVQGLWKMDGTSYPIVGTSTECAFSTNMCIWIFEQRERQREK